MTERHVLGISGGKDSAALAVYMAAKHPDLDIEYFYTDTGEELPEVYEFLAKLGFGCANTTTSCPTPTRAGALGS